MTRLPTCTAIGSIVLASLFSGSVASAQETVAPAKDAPVAAASTEPPAAKGGFDLTIGMGARYLGGRIAQAVPVNGVVADLDFRIGAYITKRIGIVGGITAGSGGLGSGCVNDCSNAIHFRLPVVAQYAFVDRTRGLYVEAGAAFASSLLASTDSKKNPGVPPETLALFSPIDAEVGLGYRFPLNATETKAARSTFDLRLSGNFGQYQNIDSGRVQGSFSGPIPSEQRDFHFGVGLGLAYHFAL